MDWVVILVTRLTQFWTDDSAVSEDVEETKKGPEMTPSDQTHIQFHLLLTGVNKSLF